MTNTLAIAFGFSSGLARLGLRGSALGRSQRFGQSPGALKVGRYAPTALRRLALSLGLGLLLAALGSCRSLVPPVPRQIVLKQAWEIESGDRVAGQLVTGSLGDVSVRLQDARLRAPFAGQVELAAKGFHCIYFSTAEVPAYLFRYCGVRQPRLGKVEAGEAMGRGGQIQFATLRRQPDGTWAIVEPSDRVLERSLNQPLPTLRF